jgi:hypothetical protein
MKKLTVVIATAAVMVPAVASHVRAQGHHGTTGKWDFNFPIAVTDAANPRGFRFTAMEAVTIDAIVLRLYDLDMEADGTVGIQSDDGSGNPRGTWLTSSNFWAGELANYAKIQVFDVPEVTLTTGSVYHVLVEKTAGVSLDLNTSGTRTQRRPYDYQHDPMFTTEHKEVSSGNWIQHDFDPFFALVNNGVAVSGPGNPYEQFAYSTVLCYKDAQVGQRFTFRTDTNEAGSVQVTSIDVRIGNRTNVTEDLKLKLRDAAGTVIGHGTLSTSDIIEEADFQEHTITLDSPVSLHRDTTYWLTTDQTTAVFGEHYDIVVGIVNPPNLLKNAGYGGTDDAFSVFPGHSWDSFRWGGPWGSEKNDHFDLYFGLNYTPVGETAVNTE